MRWLAGLLCVAMSAATAAVTAAAVDGAAEAKTLFFDRQYAEARKAWTAVRDAGGSDAAPYWIARCSELLGEHERALDEYGRYLASRPRDAFLVDEARTSRVGLAARLYRAGQKEQLRVMVDSLEDPSRTVRYFAALQLASLGAPAGRPALPVLRRIVAEERDPDLVERAKLALLRLEPHVLPPVSDSRPVPGRPRAMIHVRIREEGKPKVTVDFPLALAELVFKNLPEDARQELKKRGYEAESFLHKLKELGPTRIVEIDGDGGDKVEIWID